MKTGFGVFGKEYGVMFRNDLHAHDSIDFQFIKAMILLDFESENYLYDAKKYTIDKKITSHELYDFAQSFKGETALDSIKNVVNYTRKIINDYNFPFDGMLFGGTEKEIIERGTDWCTDISRVGCALIQCLNIPCRIAMLVNSQKAYNGHTICEAVVEGKFLMCDFTYGVYGLLDKPYSVRSLIDNHKSVRKIYSVENNLEQDLVYIVGLYDKAAFCDYDITKTHNYSVSKPNEYYLKMMKLNHDGTWKLGENTLKKSNSI